MLFWVFVVGFVLLGRLSTSSEWWRWLTWAQAASGATGAERWLDLMSRRADTRLNLITDKVNRRPQRKRSEGLGNRRKYPEIAQVLSEAERAEQSGLGE